MNTPAIPHARQTITEDDIAAVVAVLRSEWLTQGPAVPLFEQAVAEYCGTGHAVAVNSGTAALHIACLALGLAPGDRLWTSPISFVASANCGLYCGADVDFVDINPATGNLSVAALEAKLVHAATNECLPKILIAVHFAGQPCEMAAIHALCTRYAVCIVEDASHAIGARYEEAPVGNCRYCDITVFSFHPVKLITTGEGGMAMTNDAELAATMRRLRSHGVTRDRALMSEDDGSWYYQQLELGFNYRMTDIQAALGRSQLVRLDAYVERRRELAQRYDALLSGLPVELLRQLPQRRSAMHLYVVKIGAPYDRQQVFDGLRAAGIGVNVHYVPIHLQPFFRRRGFSRADFPEAERYYGQAISLPMFPAMTYEQQDGVVAALRSVLS